MKKLATLLLLILIIGMTQSTIAQAPISIEKVGRQTIDREHRLIESPTILTTNDENTQEELFEIYEVTAYTAGFESTGKTPDHPAYGITASGAYVQENHTIACGPEHEFGTEIYIPFFDTTFTCEDRGGAITEGKLDVYMESVEDALEFGRQMLEVVIGE